MGVHFIIMLLYSFICAKYFIIKAKVTNRARVVN